MPELVADADDPAFVGDFFFFDPVLLVADDVEVEVAGGTTVPGRMLPRDFVPDEGNLPLPTAFAAAAAAAVTFVCCCEADVEPPTPCSPALEVGRLLPLA